MEISILTDKMDMKKFSAREKAATVTVNVG
jgi:hypothetical protein